MENKKAPNIWSEVEAAYFTEHRLKKKRNLAKTKTTKTSFEHFRYCLGTTWKTSSPEQRTNVPTKKNKENKYWELMRQKHAELYKSFSPAH